MTSIKNVANQSIVRVGWLPLLAISTALHVGVVLGCLVAALPRASNVVLSAPQPELTSLVLLLRSHASLGRSVTSSHEAPASPAAKSSVPILPATACVATNTTTSPAAFALRDHASMRDLRDPLLSGSNASQFSNHAGTVFVLDISGSMYESYAGSSRLAFARQILAQRIRDLKEGAPFAVTLYGETARRNGPLVPANNATRAAAIGFLDQECDLGGGTNLPSGLFLAQELHVGAIVLVTDGDLNMSAAKLLPECREILGANGPCPALTIIGLGPRADTDANQLLQKLADQEGGTYASSQAGDLTASLTAKSSVVGTP